MHEKTDYFNYYTQENDPRIFPYGDTMRKSRIDELPQILNIIKGEMHLIGPRAEWNELVEDYEQQIPFYKERHLVAPGITGWAQVNYPYGSNIEDTRQKLMYDLYYIKHWSIWLDLKIVWKTVMVVAGKKGI
jgi:lipopolysaccharide/colanic/teichoic acid biosynthesis glycosyltransferase